MLVNCIICVEPCGEHNNSTDKTMDCTNCHFANTFNSSFILERLTCGCRILIRRYDKILKDKNYLIQNSNKNPMKILVKFWINIRHLVKFR